MESAFEDFRLFIIRTAYSEVTTLAFGFSLALLRIVILFIDYSKLDKV